MNYEYIPPNIEDNGGLFGGLFKTRNFIEAAIALAADYLIFVYALFFLPVFLRVLLGLASGILLAVIFIIGIDGKPVSQAALDTVMFHRTKSVTTLRMPERKVKKKKRAALSLKKKKKKGGGML